MSDAQEFIVSEAGAGCRLDRFLAETLSHVSRSRIQAVIRAGGVCRNGAEARPADVLRAGDAVSWCEPEPVSCQSARPEAIPLDILFEDAAVIVLNKPAGTVVHPGAGHAGGTLVSALLHHCGSLSRIGGVERPGIVHRLDKETSGCLVVAKSDAAHRALAQQFAGRAVEKTYLAVVEGTPHPRSGSIEAPIGRHPVHRKKMSVQAAGREAVTEYDLLASADGLSLVECRPRTGRTHQIRVHLKHLGCPVAGDPVYGRRGQWTRHLLHAWKLAFQHPISGSTMHFEAPVPAEFPAIAHGPPASAARGKSRTGCISRGET